MSKYIDELVFAIKEIQEKEWHYSTRTGTTGIGKTFEDLLDKEEDNHDLPDFYDIEIKTHETAKNSRITLFTKSPTYPKGANSILKEKYGAVNDSGVKTLHLTVPGNRKVISNKFQHSFKIEVNRKEEKLRLNVYDKRDNLINDSVFWSTNDLQKQLDKKLKTIAIVSAESRIYNERKQFKYTDVTLITDLSIDSLLDGIENGHVVVDIRIGTYKSGRNKGKTHDHGTGFRIMIKDLINYATVKRIHE